MTSVFVSEIYSSIQGEGPYTGQPQIFLRLAGCPLRCNYCDTPGSLVVKGHKQLEASEILEKILILNRNEKIKVVSITGGEPLIYAAFLGSFLPMLKKQDFRIYIETAGIHPENLKAIIKDCDVVAMDIKLPSAVGRSYWNEHKRFLKVGKNKIFTKIILEKKSELNEIKKAVLLLKKILPTPLLVLQPATPVPPVASAPSAEFVSRAYQYAAAHLPCVLVMPQQHKIWSVR